MYSDLNLSLRGSFFVDEEGKLIPRVPRQASLDRIPSSTSW
jgi:hypothetical protein